MFVLRVFTNILSRPLVCGTLFLCVVWTAKFAYTTDFRTSHPRTVPDRLLLRHASNINTVLYGTKPHFQKIDDPSYEVIDYDETSTVDNRGN